MSGIEIRNIRVINPRAPLQVPLELEIQFEALTDINGGMCLNLK